MRVAADASRVYGVLQCISAGARIKRTLRQYTRPRAPEDTNQAAPPLTSYCGLFPFYTSLLSPRFDAVRAGPCSLSLGDDHGLDHGLAAGKQERAALVAQRSLPVPAVVGAPPLSPLCRLRRCRLDCCRLRRCRLGDARAFESSRTCEIFSETGAAETFHVKFT